MSGIAVADVTLRCRCNDDHLCVELLDNLYHLCAAQLLDEGGGD